MKKTFLDTNLFIRYKNYKIISLKKPKLKYKII